MKNKGFTLIELLVTMGIIAVLAGMAVFNFNQSRMRARDVQRKSDLSQLIKTMELYKNDNGQYPDATGFQGDLLSGDYVKNIFVDPKGVEWMADNYEYAPVVVGSKVKTYHIMACLENISDSVRATVDQCSFFPNNQGVGNECVCGEDNGGVMYVVSNP